MKDNIKVISENTLVPISLLIAILGGCGFITYVYFQSEANAKAIEDLQDNQTVLIGIREDIAVIKNDIQTLKSDLNRRLK